MKRLLSVVSILLFSSLAHADSASQFNFRFNPIGLIAGSIGVALDVTVAPEWTIGPDLTYWNIKWGSEGLGSYEYSIKAMGIGARANWFKNGVFTDGLYIGPSLNYADVEVSIKDSLGTSTGKASGLFLGCLVGYGWFWDSFNMMLGGGLTAGLGGTDIKVRDSNNGSEETVRNRVAGLSAEFSLGWTF
ncbi:MAG: DUF3575 domain-containing protein [Bdellovibrionales bacterium]|nr:DUF3575 domain-containing protein [Bdellovibrionales bacterium]